MSNELNARADLAFQAMTNALANLDDPPQTKAAGPSGKAAIQTTLAIGSNYERNKRIVLAAMLFPRLGRAATRSADCLLRLAARHTRMASMSTRRIDWAVA